MASKRTINRAYWVAVKDTAHDPGHDMARQVYKLALSGQPDRRILPVIGELEATYGPARLSDVNDDTLWPARQIVDAIRARLAERGTAG